jgi:alkylation response protein AidB-like acyl-CoA dehydrogenase
VAVSCDSRSRSRSRAQALVARVREHGPEIEAAARQAELERALPAPVVALLRELGLFWLKTPDELGGTELEPLDFCDVLEEVAYHDASAGWAVMVGNGTTGFLAGSLPDEGVAEMFAPGEPLPIIAGQFVPRGTAVREDDGVRITGRWSFCSGLPHADWLSGACPADDGELLLFCVPKAEATVHDTWHVAGLQGTGSSDFSLEDHRVPAARTMPLLAQPGRRGGALHRQPARIFVGNELGPVAVGIARRAIDDMRDQALHTTRAHGATPLRDRGAFHKTLGQADAKLRAASLLYRDAVDLSWRRFLEDRVDEALVQVTMARSTYAVDLCVELVGDVFRYGGGRVLALDNPMQRHLRNLVAAAQHVFLTDENFELAGRAMLDGANVD